MPQPFLNVFQADAVCIEYTDTGIMETETFGNITVLTFAGLYRKMISGKFSKNIFVIVCFDEPQALYADALFAVIPVSCLISQSLTLVAAKRFS